MIDEHLDFLLDTFLLHTVWLRRFLQLNDWLKFGQLSLF